MKLYVLKMSGGYVRNYSRYRNKVYVTPDLANAMLFSSPDVPQLRSLAAITEPDGGQIVQLDVSLSDDSGANMKEVATMAHEEKLSVVGCVFTHPTEGNRRGEIPADKTYYYQVLPGVDVHPGDTVVVICATGWQVVDCVEVDVTEEDKVTRATAKVVAVCDMAPYNAYCDAETRRKELKRALVARRKALEGEAVYAMLAKNDPEMAALLAEYHTLGGTLEP